MSVLLSGCLSDQKRQAASCELEAENHNKEVGNYMIVCMRAHGYVWSLNEKRCKVTIFPPTEVNPYCYVPDNPIDEFVFRTELALEN